MASLPPYVLAINSKNSADLNLEDVTVMDRSQKYNARITTTRDTALTTETSLLIKILMVKMYWFARSIW